MSIFDPPTRWAKLRGAILAFLFLAGIAAAILGAGLMLGTDPHLVLERIGPRAFRVTASNYFLGYRYYTKTIEGVTDVIQTSAARDHRGDSQAERQRRQNQKSLDFYGADRRRIGWDREDDRRQIEDFMQGTEPQLALADPPSFWRKSLSWFCLAFGLFVLLGAFQNVFSKPRGLP